MDKHNSGIQNGEIRVQNSGGSSASMSSSAGTKHFYFQTTRREVNENDADAEDHPNNRSFDSVANTSNMRDQGIQQGDGGIRRPRSNRTTYIGSNRKWTEKYVSPFVLLAEQRARERARQHKLSRAQPQRPAWDDKIAPTGTLFDPTIHKQEIFKIQPRNKAAEPEVTQLTVRKHRAPSTQNMHVRHQAEDAVQFKPNGWSRMTIKTSGVITDWSALVFPLTTLTNFMIGPCCSAVGSNASQADTGADHGQCQPPITAATTSAPASDLTVAAAPEGDGNESPTVSGRWRHP